MGYRSTVEIMLEPKAYKKVMDSIAEYNNKQTVGLPFKPDCDQINKEGVHIITFNYVKWYGDFEDVKSVEHILSELNDLDDDELEGNRFKQILIGEDNATDEYSNDWDWNLGYDFSISVDVNKPNGFKEL